MKPKTKRDPDLEHVETFRRVRSHKRLDAEGMLTALVSDAKRDGQLLKEEVLGSICPGTDLGRVTLSLPKRDRASVSAVTNAARYAGLITRTTELSRVTRIVLVGPVESEDDEDDEDDFEEDDD